MVGTYITPPFIAIVKVPGTGKCHHKTAPWVKLTVMWKSRLHIPHIYILHMYHNSWLNINRECLACSPIIQHKLWQHSLHMKKKKAKSGKTRAHIRPWARGSNFGSQYHLGGL